ncbi:MAG: CPBP family intramembrane glutamic endopeptidase [Acidobacteriaceae bacterium]
MHETPAAMTVMTAEDPTSAVAPWWHTALLIALLAGGSVLNARQAHHGALEAHHATRYLGGIAAEWVLCLLVWWGLRMKRVPLAQVLGFRNGLRALGEDLIAAGIFWIISLMVLASIGVLMQLLHWGTPQKTLAALAPRNATEMLLWVALSASAGFVEELTFRGYFLRQFSSPLRALWVGVAASSLVFGISHAYEGAAGMIAIGVYGALFCVLAILRRSLRPGMIAHAWHDIFSGVMLAVAHHFHVV